MDSMDSRRITLATKPGASLAVNTYTPDNPTSLPLPLSKTLIVFLNGLAAPQTSWKPTLTILLQHHKPSLPALLTYDRYGQGASDPDPTDPPDTPYGHDADTVISDLHQLLSQACRDTLRLPPPGTNDSATTHLIFICNSIGCPLARLYAAAHPGTVPAFLFLDSMMANSDFVSVFPDPDAADLDPTTLPRDVSVRDLRHAREQYGARFHPTVPNGEGLDRRDLPRRLPFADGPVLPPGPDGRPPLVRVVGHDFERFARDGLEGPMAIPVAVTMAYMNPAWHEYNRGLCRLSAREGSSKEPIVAEGCGHLIQKDSPEFVAEQVVKLLESLCDAASA